MVSPGYHAALQRNVVKNEYHLHLIRHSFCHIHTRGAQDLNTCMSVALYVHLHMYFFKGKKTAFMFTRKSKSMYHAMGYSSILVMQAGMTFDPKDMDLAMTSLRESLQTCQG